MDVASNSHGTPQNSEGQPGHVSPAWCMGPGIGDPVMRQFGIRKSSSGAMMCWSRHCYHNPSALGHCDMLSAGAGHHQGGGTGLGALPMGTV